MEVELTTGTLARWLLSAREDAIHVATGSYPRALTLRKQMYETRGRYHYSYDTLECNPEVTNRFFGFSRRFIMFPHESDRTCIANVILVLSPVLTALLEPRLEVTPLV